MNVYFDTEFTGLHKDTTLVSIGLVSEDGKSFYAELSDYDKSYQDDWFIENVLSELLFTNHTTDWYAGIADRQIYGDKKTVACELKDWLQQFDEVQLVSDVCHYDMVLLIDLFGDAFDLPDQVTPSCHDINQDIADYFGLSEKIAFDMSREQIVTDLSSHMEEMTIPGNKHNALYDAYVIRFISQSLKKLKQLENYEY